MGFRLVLDDGCVTELCHYLILAFSGTIVRLHKGRRNASFMHSLETLAHLAPVQTSRALRMQVISVEASFIT